MKPLLIYEVTGASERPTQKSDLKEELLAH